MGWFSLSLRSYHSSSGCQLGCSKPPSSNLGLKGLKEMDGLFNLQKKMVSVLHKEMNYHTNWECSKARRLEVLLTRIRINW